MLIVYGTASSGCSHTRHILLAGRSAFYHRGLSVCQKDSKYVYPCRPIHSDIPFLRVRLAPLLVPDNSDRVACVGGFLIRLRDPIRKGHTLVILDLNCHPWDSGNVALVLRPGESLAFDEGKVRERFT